MTVRRNRGIGRRAWALVVGLLTMPIAALATEPTAAEPITPVPAPAQQPAGQVALGELLFHDPRLSGGRKVSCASCHDLSTNGADSRIHDVGADGTRTPFNTNTVFNAALSFRLNWEGNLRTLADQVRYSLLCPSIMGGSVATVAALASDAGLADRFRKSYGRAPDMSAVSDAIASYERTLLTPGSRFDDFLRGDRDALQPREQAGYALFKSVGCVACHQGVNVGGNLLERHGIFSAVAGPDTMVLRVPSLRNVAETAPYFHDGSSPTLTDAVTEMARAQLGRDLSDGQTDAIVAFLRTLTGRYQGRAITAPPGTGPEAAP